MSEKPTREELLDLIKRVRYWIMTPTHGENRAVFMNGEREQERKELLQDINILSEI